MTKYEVLKGVLEKGARIGDLNEFEEFILYVYYYAREEKARELGDKVRELLTGYQERISEDRYNKHIKEVLKDNRKYIYDIDYSGEFSSAFGEDEIDLSDFINTKEEV